MDEEESTDTFRVEFTIIPCAILAYFIHYRFTVTEILWSFSIFLEAVAILPQLHMLKRTGQAEALTRYYIVTLGTYRAMYIFNWIYRCVVFDITGITRKHKTNEHFRFIDTGMVDPIAVTGGLTQTCINFYFIYEYFKKYPSETDIEFPLEESSPHSSVALNSDAPLQKLQSPTERNASIPNVTEVPQVTLSHPEHEVSTAV